MAGLMVDTDVLIDYLRDQAQVATFLESLEELPCVSVVSVAELFAGVRDGAEREALEGMLSVCRVVDLSYETAMFGGLFRRDYGKSHGIGLADALIAASARQQGCRLATLNMKHYPLFDQTFAPYQKG